MAERDPVGYQHIIEILNLQSRVRPLEVPAYLSGSVNQKVRGHNGFWYPRKTAVEQTLIGHVECFPVSPAISRLCSASNGYATTSGGTLITL